jgi:hypothetical protein
MSEWVDYYDRLAKYERLKADLRALGLSQEELARVWNACVNKAGTTTYTLVDLLTIYKNDIMQYGKPNLSIFIFDE